MGMEPTASTAEPAGEAPPQVRKFGCLKIFLCGLGLVLLVLGAWHVRVYFAREAFLRHAEELVAEFEAGRSPVPEEENAAALYDEAFRLYVRPEKSGASGADRDKLYSVGKALDASAEALAGYLKANEPLLAALRAAQARPQCQYPVDLRDPKSACHKHNSEARHSAAFVAIAARVRGREGRTAEAVDLLLAGTRLARDTEEAPLPFPRLIRMACEGQVLSGIEWLLADCEVAANDLNRLLEALRRAEAERSRMEDVLRADKAFHLHCYYGPWVSGKTPKWESYFWRGILSSPDEDDATSRRAHEMPSEKWIRFWQHSGYVLPDARHAERVMEALAAAAAESYPEALDSAERIHREACQRSEWWKQPLGDQLGVAPSILRSEANTLARLRAAQLALGCRLHKLKFGAYPEKLAELSAKFPERFKTLPADPFTGQDFLYKRTAAGCRVWSVGKNRQDDGGLSRAERDMKKPDVYDEVFELKR